jgi:3-isopropylmalate dehydratase small subunit
MSDARAELRLPVLTGRAWAFADNLAAADILPARCAALTPKEAAGQLFADLDPDLASRLQAGDVLVAGQHLGAGHEGQAAARALAAAGIVAAVAGSFAPGFAEALLAAGLYALEVDAPAVFHTGARMRLNLEAGTIANLSSGDRQPIRNLTEEFLDRLRARFGR